MTSQHPTPIGLKRRSSRALAVLALASTLVTACGGGGGSPVVYSFAVLGCNRVAEPDVTPGNPSTANLAQLERSFAEIAGLQPTPNLVFFTGDLVYGLTSDLNTLRNELEAWVSVYRTSPLGQNSAIRLVALPGNHESLEKLPHDSEEVSNPGAAQVWLDVMAPFIAGDNGPPAGGPDHLETDQRRLTYSFTFRDSHFIVLNTDPFGEPASVPVNWIANDLVTARLTTAIQHVFILGHKPAFTPPFATPDDSLDVRPDLRNVFWDTLNNYDATAYLAAHAHVYDRRQPMTTTEPGVQRTWQIVAGNGGSPVDPKWAASGVTPYYGYSIVSVTEDGRTFLTTYGRHFDQANYLAPSPPQLYPTTLYDSADITFP